MHLMPCVSPIISHVQAVEVSSQYDGCKMAGQTGTLADNDARQQFLWDVSVRGTGAEVAGGWPAGHPHFLLGNDVDSKQCLVMLLQY